MAENDYIASCTQERIKPNFILKVINYGCEERGVVSALRELCEEAQEFIMTEWSTTIITYPMSNILDDEINFGEANRRVIIYPKVNLLFISFNKKEDPNQIIYEHTSTIRIKDISSIDFTYEDNRYVINLYQRGYDRSKELDQLGKDLLKEQTVYKETLYFNE